MSADDKRPRRPSTRPVKLAELPPGAARDLRDAIYRLYLEAGTPLLSTLADSIAEDESLPGSPKRDMIGKIIGGETLGSQQDAVTIAVALAREAGRDNISPLADQIREMWLTSRTSASSTSRREEHRRAAAWIVAGAESTGDANDHFWQRAYGLRSPGRSGDLFFGRQAALEATRVWLTGANTPAVPLVITGNPGSGKSSVAARTVMNLRHQQDGSVLGFHARGATAMHLLAGVRQMLHAAGVEPSDSGSLGSVIELVEVLRREVDRRWIIVVDALDEASTGTARQEMVAILTAVTEVPSVRVAVATRGRSGAGQARFDRRGLLHQLAARSPHSPNLVDLDADSYADPAGIVDCAAALLTRTGADETRTMRAAWTAYRADPALCQRLAEVIAERAATNYLVAVLAADDLAVQPEPLDPAADGFDPSDIPASVEDAIDKYLTGLQDRDPVWAQQVVGLLTALAYARGAGLDNRRWLAVAAALGYTATTAQLEQLRDSPAVDYLLQSSPGDGSASVTRLFHEALVDDLLRRRASAGYTRRNDETTIVRSLLPASSDAWEDADAYTRAHVAEHAHAAGQLPALLHDLRFLAVGDLDRLLPLLPARPAPEVLPIVTVLRQATDAVFWEPVRRARLFALTAAHLGLVDLQARLESLHEPDLYRVGWAHPLGTPHQVLGGYTGEEVQVAIGQVDDRVVIVSGDSDGLVYVHDAASAARLAQLPSHDGGVASIAVSPQGAGGVIAVGGHSGDVRTYRFVTEPAASINAGTGVYAVALGRLDERDAVAIGTEDGLLVCDALTGELRYQVGERGSRVHAVACGHLDSQHVIACCGDDGVVLRDLRSGSLIRHLSGPMEEGPDAVSFLSIDGRRMVLASGMDGSVVVDIATGELVHHLSTGVMGTAVANVGGEDLILAADLDNSIEVIDARTGRVRRALFGHSETVISLAASHVGGRDVVVSGSLNAMARVYDLDPDATAVIESPSGFGKVEELVAGCIGGRAVVVSHGERGVMTYDAGTGRPTGPALRAPSAMSIALGRAGDRDILACGGAGGALQVFDAATHELLGDWSDATWFCVTALAIGTAGGRDILVVGTNGWKTVVLDACSGQPIMTIKCEAWHLALGQAQGQDFMVAVSNSGDCRVFDLATGEMMNNLTPITGPLRSTATTCLDGRAVVATGGCDGRVLLVDPIAAVIVEELPEHDGDVLSIAVTNDDGDLVVVTGGHDAVVRVTAVPDNYPFEIDVVDVVNAVAASDEGGIFVASGTSIFNLTYPA